MALSIKQKQNSLYLGMVLLTILIAIVSYRTIQKQWLLYRKAEVRFREEKFQEAISLYKESLAIGLTNDNIFSHLAAAYIAIGNFSEAIKWYRVYLDLYPHDKAIRFEFARALSWNGNIQEAEQEYQKVLKESDERDQTH